MDLFSLRTKYWCTDEDTLIIIKGLIKPLRVWYGQNWLKMHENAAVTTPTQKPNDGYC